ncbi:MAG TPA: energy transducer TonB [Pyrinomonadaceae bacterium]|nr:energy transducer TonB [Pyrinomonadaceae bacterium]
MKKSITNYELRITIIRFLSAFLRVHSRLIFPLFLFCAVVSAQPKIAVLIPDKTSQSRVFAEKLESSLSSNAKILDASLSETAFRARAFENPFNLTVNEAKNVGAAIGCDYFLLVRAENLRRVSLSKGEFYESYAAIFTVDSRTGKLVFWNLNSFESEKAEEADKKLFDSATDSAREISGKLKIANQSASNEKQATVFEKLPDEDSPEARDFRSPLPYKRLRPEYTSLANLYRVEATVDAEIDLDENGKIIKIEIVRWAGFGLDESVAENIGKMNWRPAERSGKALPIRVLLRYNFKKIETE